MYCFKIFSLVCGLTFSPDVMFSSSSSLVRTFTSAVLFFSSKSNFFPRYVNESPIVPLSPQVWPENSDIKPVQSDQTHCFSLAFQMCNICPALWTYLTSCTRQQRC